MFKLHLRKIALAAMASGALVIVGCTRSASTPVTGGTSATPAALTGQQATMEAVRAALLTQTAQAMARATIALPTNVPTNVPTIALATATPRPGTTALPLGSPTPTGGAGCPYTYVVQPSDTGLFRIAIDLGYDPDFWIKIAEANNLTEPWLVYPGDELTIPCP
ncbi:MAG: LysM peptidoglycan-binding domain-containing protein [Anaerolineales bacterium]